MLEKHILEAKARALALEDRENLRRNQICSEPDLYGVPAGKTAFIIIFISACLYLICQIINNTHLLKTSC